MLYTVFGTNLRIVLCTEIDTMVHAMVSNTVPILLLVDRAVHIEGCSLLELCTFCLVSRPSLPAFARHDYCCRNQCGFTRRNRRLLHRRLAHHDLLLLNRLLEETV
jgi:hypothetical protein